MMKHCIFTVIVIIWGTVANAATYTVTTTNDAGVGSLRQAITDANNNTGPDNIHFNIPDTDSNYNASTGVWTICLNTELPMISGGYTNIDGTTQTSNQGNTNEGGPEIAIDGNNTITYGFRIVSPENTVKGFIIGNFEFGFQFYSTMTTGNNIENNYIGTDYQGANVCPNDYGIVMTGDATGITISNNLISGNSVCGIGATEANGITITGNKIGTVADGNSSLSNTNGIVLNNAYNCTIGGNTMDTRNLISGNANAGILINDTLSVNNVISGNYIGTNTTASDSVPNGNGVILASAAGNSIGGITANDRNIISGNTQCGVLINGTGANNNTITGNFIGTDETGTMPLGNHCGVIIKADADNNRVGGDAPEERNIISANWEIGVYIEASDSNVVSGNFIGPDVTGITAFSFGDSLIQANGVEINTFAKHNIIGGNTQEERNIISGNRVYGAIYYGQVSQNNIAGNYIGTDVSGNIAIPNATGICVDDASNNNIIENNVLSGNISYGLFIVTTGTNYNVFRGNKVGTNAAGTDTVPNDVGLAIAAGAKHNMIGGSMPSDRNIFSGNHYAGIELVDTGTDFNVIQGNYIGVDSTGNAALPNCMGIGISAFVSSTTIDSNVISGNSAFGIVLTDETSGNMITNNRIGTGADSSTHVGNGASGIVLEKNANNNVIGGADEGNCIAYNDSAGIVLLNDAGINNTISGNAIFDNNLLGIDIFPSGVNANDAGDVDTGPNQMLNYPVIVSAEYNAVSDKTLITGTLDTQNPELCTVELFRASPDELYNYGEGWTFLGSKSPDDTGNWTLQVSGLMPGDELTATTIDHTGNTSEFAQNFTTVLSIDDEFNNLVSGISLFPNPATEKITIDFTLKEKSRVNIKLMDVSGQYCEILHNDILYRGQHKFNYPVNQLKSGCYVIMISANERMSVTKKFQIIK